MMALFGAVIAGRPNKRTAEYLHQFPKLGRRCLCP